MPGDPEICVHTDPSHCHRNLSGSISRRGTFHPVGCSLLPFLLSVSVPIMVSPAHCGLSTSDPSPVGCGHQGTWLLVKPRLIVLTSPVRPPSSREEIHVTGRSTKSLISAPSWGSSLRLLKHTSSRHETKNRKPRRFC